MSEELFFKYFEGTLTPSERNDLKQLLSSDSVATRQFADYCIEQAILICVTGVDKEKETESESAPKVPVNIPNVLRWAWLPVAASVVVAMGIGLWKMNVGRDGSPLPMLAGKTVEVGRPIATSENEDAELLYQDGTRVVLRAGSTFQVPRSSRSKSLELLQGALVAEAAKQPTQRPMVLETVQGRFTVLGTKFFLMIAESSVPFTRLDVTEGAVKCQRDGREWTVQAGQAICLGEGVEPKLIPSSGREFSPKYGGVFYRDHAELYASGRMVLEGQDPMGNASMESVSLVAALERIRSNGLPAREKLDAKLRDNKLELEKKRDSGQVLWMPMGVPRDEVWGLTIRFRLVQNSISSGVSALSNPEMTDYIPPEGWGGPSPKKNPILKRAIQQFRVANYLARVGQTSAGTDIYEYRDFFDHELMSQGWRQGQGPVGHMFKLTGGRLDILEIQFSRQDCSVERSRGTNRK